MEFVGCKLRPWFLVNFGAAPVSAAASKNLLDGHFPRMDEKMSFFDLILKVLQAFFFGHAFWIFLGGVGCSKLVRTETGTLSRS